jgi:hypothetical protein
MRLPYAQRQLDPPGITSRLACSSECPHKGTQRGNCMHEGNSSLLCVHGYRAGFLEWLARYPPKLRRG